MCFLCVIFIDTTNEMERSKVGKWHIRDALAESMSLFLNISSFFWYIDPSKSEKVPPENEITVIQTLGPFTQSQFT